MGDTDFNSRCILDAASVEPSEEKKMNSRRRFLAGLSAPALASLAPPALARVWQPSELPEGAEPVLDSLSGKVPLIKRSYRPPNFETPIDYFRQPIQPNDAF